MLPPDMAWMNWDGWRWAGIGLALALGFANGWAWRGVSEAYRNLRLAIDNTRNASISLVSKISTMTDPRRSQNVDDEIECWAEIVEEAKAIAGDNSVADEDGPDAC